MPSAMQSEASHAKTSNAFGAESLKVFSACFIRASTAVTMCPRDYGDGETLNPPRRVGQTAAWEFTTNHPRPFS
jgi:hypothetical protein